jgi:hypothetical protein
VIEVGSNNRVWSIDTNTLVPYLIQKGDILPLLGEHYNISEEFHNVYFQRLLDARKKYSQVSLADLYDPLQMPRELFTAHKKLDLAVDRCYRSRGKFNSNLERIAFLFDLYDKYTHPH